MAEKVNFILGRGETLAVDVKYRNRDGRSEPPYSLSAQKKHLAPLFKKQAEAMRSIPKDACPNDQAVSIIVLHPQYYSRSAFPERLLKKFDLRLIGSKPVQVKPRAGRGSENDSGASSTAIFVAAKRSTFSALAEKVQSLTEDDKVSEDILKIESVSSYGVDDRLMGQLSKEKSDLEVVVHFDSFNDWEWEDEFVEFAKQAGIKLEANKTYQSRGLWFLSASGTSAAAGKLAQFTFVRAIRPMPKLRILEKPTMLRSAASTPKVILPAEQAVDPDCKVAVFDGGLHPNHPFGLWATAIEPAPIDGIGNAIPELLDHGTAVTSAVLFGHVEGGHLPRPYCSVDHYRVLGDKVSDKALYNVMLYVDKILSQSNYSFATFSFGPNEVAGDDHVTAWTSMLDDHLGSSELLATVAVGNNGELPWPDNRIMIPSDSVNAIAIGASDSLSEEWQRASYSCIGPGRHPGLVKPDLVHFGGIEENPFRFVFPGPVIAGDCGTSYATPAVMRVAAGLRAFFGSSLSPLAIRTLLIHSADQAGHDRDSVGWGSVPRDITNITVCPDGSVRVLYQGKLKPGKVLRAPIPLPSQELKGDVHIAATFCYSCTTDPHTPGDYTRAGLDVTFRPHSKKFKKDPLYPDTASFFKRNEKSKEQELRNDAHKWDTVLHNELNKRGSSLHEPVFDIHYLARQPGIASSPVDATSLSYALVVTVTSEKNQDLYDRVLARYANRLTVIKPRLDLPISVTNRPRRS
ncbi:S8 family peptidase [Herbaspirillum frisingense]|uniref:S8 family peptidase n=1 Tax=Herbaspirillum frisingense TaxID=92645 RepID=UPI0039AF5F6B